MKTYSILKEYETEENREKYIGKIFSSNEFGNFKVLGVGDKTKNKDTLYICEFINTGFQVLALGSNIIKGRLKDLYVPKVYGIGYIGSYDKKLNAQNNECYKQWLKMLDRCYVHKNGRSPTYIDCEVTKEWHNFGNFANDYENILGFKEMQEYPDIKFHLDKDILFHKNKIYSFQTCCFVPEKINILFVNIQNTKSLLPTGLSYHHNGQIRVTIFFNNKQEHLGLFSDTLEGIKEAKEMYWVRKLQIANIYLQEYSFLNERIQDAVIKKVKFQAFDEDIELK